MSAENIGLPRGTVRLVPYDSRWPEIFEAEKRNLQSVLEDNSEVEHVGSTAIPGLPAKPIIDICLVIDRLADYLKLVPKLESIGYTFMPDRVFEEEVFMPKGPENNRNTYLHIVQKESSEYRNLIVFRDRLRADSTLVKRYAELEVKLAAQFSDDRKSYTSAKDSFIKGVLR